MSTTTSCGQCGAPLRPDQGWCSLCYAQVESTFDPLTAPLDELLELSGEVVAEPVVEALPEEATPVERPHQQTESVLAAPYPSLPVPPETQVDAGEELTDVDVLLSMLAAEHRKSDPAAGLAERMEDRSTRIGVMVGGTILIAGLGFLVLTVLGAVF